ncbi:response regulator [Novosphingobium sp.]|uniref:response regulator n=1 Tax=Novosphingobium sp. TaxID=1874826 RepID=UPI002736A6BF|nr:response regulator [Novosphingobium sp.]MDP3908591.1 response regulator [Novosphingobium sp.]
MTETLPKLRVLVVEDEPLVGMEIEYTIEELGHEVVGPVAQLVDAVAAAADATLGCAILDINIRGGHSYPVADLLLARGVPVLLLSGYGRQSLPDRLQAAAYLTKPFTSGQLQQEVRNLCARTAADPGP